jgi:hypothetical protein
MARRYGPAAGPLGGRVLAPRCPALAQEPDSCRRASRRQGLNVVAYGGRSLPLCGTAIYFSKIMTN